MNPQHTVGAFSQHYWPGVGDIDDCWVVASLQAVAAVAPWSYLHTVPTFRAKAGNPDEAGVQDGGTIAQSAKAIRALYPELDIEVSTGNLTWSQFLSRVKAGHPAMVFLMSSGLLDKYEYGYKGEHAVAVAWDGASLRIANPLARPHSRWRVIAPSELETAVKAVAGAGVQGILMPTVAQAFQTHPLLAGAIADAKAGLFTQAQLDAAVAAGKVGLYTGAQVEAIKTDAMATAQAQSADNAATIASLQAANAQLTSDLAGKAAEFEAAQSNLAASLAKQADLQGQLDTANQALADSRLSLGKWDALRRLLRELLGLSN